MRAALWAVFGVVLALLAVLPVVLGLYPTFAFMVWEAGSAAAAAFLLVAAVRWWSGRT
jgi:uncharacterized membrane protein YbaN (DUF454 family)